MPYGERTMAYRQPPSAGKWAVLSRAVTSAAFQRPRGRRATAPSLSSPGLVSPWLPAARSEVMHKRHTLQDAVDADWHSRALKFTSPLNQRRNSRGVPARRTMRTGKGVEGD